MFATQMVFPQNMSSLKSENSVSRLFFLGKGANLTLGPLVRKKYIRTLPSAQPKGFVVLAALQELKLSLHAPAALVPAPSDH